MKKLLTLFCLCTLTLMVSAQDSTKKQTSESDSYQPCPECFGYNTYGYNTDGYKQTTAERQYNQTCINGLNYENGYERPRNEFGNRILRIAIGLVSFAVIVAILPRHDTPYIQ